MNSEACVCFVPSCFQLLFSVLPSSFLPLYPTFSLSLYRYVFRLLFPILTLFRAFFLSFSVIHILWIFCHFIFQLACLKVPFFPTFYWLQCTTPLLRTCVSVAFYRRMLNILYLARQLCALCISAFGVLR